MPVGSVPILVCNSEPTRALLGNLNLLLLLRSSNCPCNHTNRIPLFWVWLAQKLKDVFNGLARDLYIQLPPA